MQPTGCLLLVNNYHSEINNQANFVVIVFMDSIFDYSTIWTQYSTKDSVFVFYVASINAVITIGATDKLKVFELRI